MDGQSPKSVQSCDGREALTVITLLSLDLGGYPSYNRDFPPTDGRL